MLRCPPCPSGTVNYALRWNDLQSVHWSTVGLASCVPTVMQSSAQYSAPLLWFAHWSTVQRIALLQWDLSMRKTSFFDFGSSLSVPPGIIHLPCFLQIKSRY